MKKVLYLSLLCSSAFITAANAENTLPTPVIGIVEQATLDKSDALKSIIKQVDAKRQEIQSEMKKYENELKNLEQKLVEQQKTLSEKEFAQKRQEFEKRLHEVQSKLDIRRAQMELGVEEAKKKVYEAFLKAAEKVKASAGANVIIYKETIVTADPAFDLTPQVLKELNDSLPTVKVVFKSEAEVKKQLQQQPPQL